MTSFVVSYCSAWEGALKSVSTITHPPLSENFQATSRQGRRLRFGMLTHNYEINQGVFVERSPSLGRSPYTHSLFYLAWSEKFLPDRTLAFKYLYRTSYPSWTLFTLVLFPNTGTTQFSRRSIQVFMGGITQKTKKKLGKIPLNYRKRQLCIEMDNLLVLYSSFHDGFSELFIIETFLKNKDPLGFQNYKFVKFFLHTLLVELLDTKISYGYKYPIRFCSLDWKEIQ